MRANEKQDSTVNVNDSLDEGAGLSQQMAAIVLQEPVSIPFLILFPKIMGLGPAFS